MNWAPPPPGRRGQDKMFRWMMGRLFLIILLYGCATTLLLLSIETTELVKRTLITAFSGMFSGYLGLGAGYLIGRPNDDDDPPPRR